MTEKPTEAYRGGYLDATRAPLRRRRHVSAPYLRKPRSSRWVNQSRTVSPPLFPAWRSPHARKQPRSGRRQSHPVQRRPRPETPQRRLSYAARNCRRSLAALCPLPGAPLVSNVCKLLTTAPVEPSCSVGIGPPSGKAAHVAGPTIASTVSPAPCWNCLTGLCCKVIAEDGRTGINWIRSFMRRYRKER